MSLGARKTVEVTRSRNSKEIPAPRTGRDSRSSMDADSIVQVRRQHRENGRPPVRFMSSETRKVRAPASEERPMT